MQLKQSNKKINGKRGVQLKQYNEILAGQNSENSHGTPESSKRKRDDNGEGSKEAGRLEAEVKRRKIESSTLPPHRASQTIGSTNAAAVVSPPDATANQPFTLHQAEGAPSQSTHMDEDSSQGFYFLDQWVDFGPSG